MEIRTSRLTLRTARADDLEAFHRVLSDLEATRWWSTPAHRTLDETAAWLKAMIDQGPDNPDFVVEHAGEVIGKAGFFMLPEVGYILRPDHWGRGLAHEAVTASIDHVFATRRLNVLTAEVDPDNAASMRLLERLGYRQTGFAGPTLDVAGDSRDGIHYALSREDWTKAA